MLPVINRPKKKVKRVNNPYGQFGGTNFLPEVSVYGVRDERTLKELDKLRGKPLLSDYGINMPYPIKDSNKQRSDDIFQSWLDNGTPNIRPLGTISTQPGIRVGRAYMDPYGSMPGSTNEGALNINSGNLDEYFAELSHTKQLKKFHQPGGGDIPWKYDNEKYPTRELYDQYTYSDPLSGEYAAHKIIEPKLRQQYYKEGFLRDDEIEKFARDPNIPMGGRGGLPTEDVDRISAERTKIFNQNKKSLGGNLFPGGGDLPTINRRQWLMDRATEDPRTAAVRQNSADPNFAQRQSDDLWNTVNTVGSFTPAWPLFAANQMGRSIDKGEYGQAGLEGAMIAAPYAIGKGVQAALSYVKKALQNTYKINPFAFKPNPEAYYRGIGADGLNDAVESGLFRSPTGRSSYKGIYKTPETYWADAENFDVAKRQSIRTNNSILDGKSIIAEYPKNESSINPMMRGLENNKYMDNYVSIKQLPISKGKILKQDWLRGYKQIKTNK